MRDQILETIQRDLASFADPGTEVLVTERGATWYQNRRPMDLVFTRGEEELPRLEFKGQAYSYKGFFASENMGDLPTLAEVIYQSMVPPSNYVDAPARREGTEQAVSAIDVLTSLSTVDLPFGATRVVFVRGAAGAGKTVALKQATIRQAESVAIGGSQVLFFYIDAQARALARLDEAVALLLQDLRASFTYRALATLTRLGLVVPIVDGFDELLGAGGYGEAFDSLAKFLARLDGRGSLIASARSTFYEYRDFRETAARYEKGGSLNFEITPVDVLPWGEREAAAYLELSNALTSLGATTAPEGLQKLQDRLGPSGQQFLHTPFFVATLVELLKQGTFVTPSSRIVPQVIRHFIAREKEKLRDRQDHPIISEEGHARFLEMLSEEMWWQGGRELDIATVKVVAELLADAIGIDPNSRITFVERSPSYAFFESRQHEGRRFLGFTHEYYYSYFLGQFIARAVSENDGLEQLLARARMSPLFGDEFAHAIAEGELNRGNVVRNLSSRRIPSLTRELNRTNSGTLFAGLARILPDALSGERVSNGLFVQEDLSTTNLSATEFFQCDFVRCDLQGANWEKVRFAGSTLVEPLVDPHKTRLGGLELETGETLLGLVVVSAGRETVVYDPTQLEDLAGKIGVRAHGHVEPEAGLSEQAKSTIELLKKFLRIASRLFYVSDDDLLNKGIANNPRWHRLEALLFAHDLMEQVAIQRQGPHHLVRRMKVLPTDLQQGETGKSRNSAVSRFWAAIKAL